MYTGICIGSRLICDLHTCPLSAQAAVLPTRSVYTCFVNAGKHGSSVFCVYPTVHGEVLPMSLLGERIVHILASVQLSLLWPALVLPADELLEGEIKGIAWRSEEHLPQPIRGCGREGTRWRARP